MQRVSIRSLSLAVIAICTINITAAFAQSVSYLDQNYQPASEKSYAFKRVIKYKSRRMNLNLGIGYYNTTTAHPTPSIIHDCSLTDYFPGGEPALIADVVSLHTDCTNWSFDGKVVYYYRSGHIRKIEVYSVGKLVGDVITYAEDGRIVTKEHYEDGKLIDNTKYAVAPNHPLVGKWKYVKYVDGVTSPIVQYTLEATISSNGIVSMKKDSGIQTQEWQKNWKYTSTGPATGVEEGFLGGELVGRGDIRWINKNEFEFTTTFSIDPNEIGERLRYVRE